MGPRRNQGERTGGTRRFEEVDRRGGDLPQNVYSFAGVAFSAGSRATNASEERQGRPRRSRTRRRQEGRLCVPLCNRRRELLGGACEIRNRSDAGGLWKERSAIVFL